MKLRFFRTICGRFAVLVSIRDELSTASVGSSQAPTARRRGQLCAADRDALAGASRCVSRMGRLQPIRA